MRRLHQPWIRRGAVLALSLFAIVLMFHGPVPWVHPPVLY